ncbi:hypothetical protein TPELB_15130 [Terrisporobacter petrolearius]|uniref:DNA helicase n=1 Tax=Terrisporobacter petrolearius TaxID=1460447 RepID=A0ABZ3FBP6_9FIRM
MSDFIQGDNFDRVGGEAEEIVWTRVKDAFSKREVLGYSRYPLFSKIGERRKEPDILLLDKEYGVIIIEIKSYTIHNIKVVEPNLWEIENYSDITINPIAQAEDYLYSVKSKFEMDRNIRHQFRGKAFVALPNITKDEWENKGFIEKIDTRMLLFKDDLTKSSLLEKINTQQYLFNYGTLDDEGFRIAQSILGHETLYRSESESVNIIESKSKPTKGEIYRLVRNKLYDLDIDQENIAKYIAPGPQRIRGIAGSGKTILLCQKAAIMHLRYPEWKIAMVFFTQSLYENVIDTIDTFLRAFSNGGVFFNENSNLKVLHAWGRKGRTGFYKEVAERNGCRFRNAGHVRAENNGEFLDFNNSINYIAKKLLEECDGNLEEIYDAILIDEGQDLVGDDEYKYENKQSFYYMAYKSLKPIKNEDRKIKRLIWAYDELQSLSDKKIPSSEEIFGDKTLVQGKYKGGINKSEIMKKCYRTPYDILTTAHAVGMGLFREKGMLSGYTRKNEWENVGYEVLEGDFRKVGSKITVYRPKQNSPNPIEEFDKEKKIKLCLYNSEFDMIKDLAKNIEKDIKVGNLNSSKDILILNLYKRNTSKYDQEIGRLLNSKGINFYIPSQPNKNQYKCDWRDSQPDLFWYDDAVTISQIGRAKGNEAPMVYIVGLEDIAKDEASIKERNKLFTAMTRAKCWVNLMGVGSYSLYEEIERAVKSNGTFEFKYSKPKKETNDSMEEVNELSFNV